MSKLRATIDRIEGQMAVLLIGDEDYRVVIPRKMLPADAGEGAVITISMQLEPDAAADAKRRVQDLIDRLSGRDD